MLSIGDVSKLFGIPVHTIRYWEKEFNKELSPARTQGRQRRYTDQDIKRILRIKDLLWERGYSIRAARILLSGREDSIRYRNGIKDEELHRGIWELSENAINNLNTVVTAP